MENKKLIAIAVGAGVFVLFALVMGLLYATGTIFPKVNPLAQYTTERNCSFMSDTNRAYCTDGTVWDVKPSNPLP